MTSLLHHMIRRRRTGPATRRRERGAALVEFSIVASLLLTLCVGTYEMGMAWNDAQLITQAARSGARVGAQLGTDTQTDQRILEAVEAALGDLEPNLVKVVVFNAGSGGAIPPPCETTGHPGSANKCATYEPVHITSFAQGSWAPSTRDDTLGGADYLGVYIEIDRPFLSGFLGPTSLTIREQAVMRIEPVYP